MMCWRAAAARPVGHLMVCHGRVSPQGVADGVRRGVIMASAVGRVGRHGKYTLPCLTNPWQAPETSNIGGILRFLASAAPRDRSRSDASVAYCGQRHLPYGTPFYSRDMHRLTGPTFTALLARAGVSQAAFARLAGVTPRQVNKWCRGRTAVPAWAAVIAVVLQDRSPEALTIDLEETLQSLALPQDPRA